MFVITHIVLKHTELSPVASSPAMIILYFIWQQVDFLLLNLARTTGPCTQETRNFHNT